MMRAFLKANHLKPGSAFRRGQAARRPAVSAGPYNERDRREAAFLHRCKISKISKIRLYSAGKRGLHTVSTVGGRTDSH